MYLEKIIFGKILVPEIWVKMLLTNRTAVFLNQLYLQKKMMKNRDFFHVDTNSLKLKVDSKTLRWTWS